MSVDLLLSRLDDPRPNGRDRWRCACPVCGGRNRSTLSVGVGDTGAVLLKCWKGGCSAEEIALAVGLSIEDLFPPRESTGAPLKRRRLISAQQALDLLGVETQVIYVIACDMHAGREISKANFAQLQDAAATLLALSAEVDA
jgi:hypothetical protein